MKEDTIPETEFKAVYEHYDGSVNKFGEILTLEDVIECKYAQEIEDMHEDGFSNIGEIQYTGMEDDEKQKIFDGDKCRLMGTEAYSDSVHSTGDDWLFTGIVKFNNYTWVVEDVDKCQIPLSYIATNDVDIKITGSIYAK